MSITQLRVVPCENPEQRKPFSFDISQTDQRGMVLLDACVPAVMATAFLQMLIAFEQANLEMSNPL